MKNIVYRGGLLNFRIPGSWVEEYEDEGGGTFYDETSDSGTLRLNVLTFESPQEVNTELILEVCRYQQNRQDFQVGVLPNGNIVSSYLEQAKEDEKNMVVYYWEVGNPILKNYIRLAIFSYTVMTKNADKLKIQTDIALLDREIKRVQFTTKLGIY